MTREKKPVTMPGEMEELKELAQPLVEFLREHYDPYCQVIVNMDFVKVTGDELQVELDGGIYDQEQQAYLRETLKFFKTF